MRGWALATKDDKEATLLGRIVRSESWRRGGEGREGRRGAGGGGERGSPSSKPCSLTCFVQNVCKIVVFSLFSCHMREYTGS